MSDALRQRVLALAGENQAERERSQPRTGADDLQRPLRSRFQARLTAGVEAVGKAYQYKWYASRINISACEECTETDFSYNLVSRLWIEGGTTRGGTRRRTAAGGHDANDQW
jgi:hypothetical protein